MTTKYAQFPHIAAYADAIHAGSRTDAEVLGATYYVTDDGLVIFREGGGRGYRVEAIREGGSDPRQRAAIVRTASLAAR